MLDQCCETTVPGSLVSDVPQQQSTTDELKHEPRSTNRAPGVCDYEAKNFEECEKLRAEAEVAPLFDDVNPCLDSQRTSAPVDSLAIDMATSREAEEELWLRHLLRVALDHECRRCLHHTRTQTANPSNCLCSGVNRILVYLSVNYFIILLSTNGNEQILKT